MTAEFTGKAVAMASLMAMLVAQRKSAVFSRSKPEIVPFGREIHVWWAMTQGRRTASKGQPSDRLMLLCKATSHHRVACQSLPAVGRRKTGNGQRKASSLLVSVTSCISCPARVNSAASVAETDSMPPTEGEKA